MELHATDRSPLPPIAVSIPEASRLSGLGRSTLYELIASGQLETRKVGRRRLVLVASLRSLLEAPR